MELTPKSRLVSAKGGTIDFTSEGEVLFSVYVPPGVHDARQYLDLAPAGAELEVTGDLVVLAPRSGVGIQKYGKGSHDSGANPDFRPTIASRFEREMRHTISKMQGTIKAQAARLKSWSAAVPQVPRAAPQPSQVPPAENEAPVVE